MKNNNQGIKYIEIGEIIRIKNRDWLMIETTHKNGRVEWEQPTLIQLDKAITKTPKKFRGCDKTISPFKKFKSIKLTNGK